MSLIFLCIELALLALLRFMGMEEIPDALAAALILVYSFAYIACVSRKPHCKKCAPALIAGYVFRIALLFWDIYGSNIYQLPNSGADSVGFYNNSIAFAVGRRHGMGSFPEVMGTLFKYCGISRLFGQFIITLFSMVSLEIAAKAFSLMTLDEKRANTGMWIVCLLPNFAILSVLFLRESIVAMFISLSLYEYIKWFKQKKELSFIVAIALTFGAMYFHSGAIAVPVGYLLTRLLYDKNSEKLKFSVTNLIIVGLLLLVGVFVLNRFGDSFLVKFQNASSLEDIANENSSGGSSYARYVGNSNNIPNMIIYTIPRIVFFQFSPMPWLIRGLSDIIAFCFSSCFYIVTIYQFFRYLRKGGKENREFIIIIFIVCMCAAFVFGWGVSNAGTACRHRDKMTIVWAILYAFTLKPQKEYEYGNSAIRSLR